MSDFQYEEFCWLGKWVKFVNEALNRKIIMTEVFRIAFSVWEWQFQKEKLKITVTNALEACFQRNEDERARSNVRHFSATRFQATEPNQSGLTKLINGKFVLDT